MCFGGGGNVAYLPTPTQAEVNARTGDPYAQAKKIADVPDEGKLTRIDENRGQKLGQTDVSSEDNVSKRYSY